LKQDRTCFVIGPIGRHKSSERKHADALLKKIIKPTFAKHFKQFKIQRSDHIAQPGMIDSQVITHLIEAELVIADITDRNANAFYELGIRHMLQKPAIHLFRRGDVIPMDIAPYRAIEFDYKKPEDVREAKIALRKTVAEAILPTFVLENPVTRSAGFIRLQNVQPKRAKRKSRIVPRRFWKRIKSLHDAPGITWTKKGDEFTATWKPPAIMIQRGYSLKSINLWRGKREELSSITKDFITDRANALQQEMHMWDNELS
jgi:hypothetical protein